MASPPRGLRRPGDCKPTTYVPHAWGHSQISSALMLYRIQQKVLYTNSTKVLYGFFDDLTEVRAIADRPTKMVWSGYYDPAHVAGQADQIQPGPEGPRAK